MKCQRSGVVSTDTGKSPLRSTAYCSLAQVQSSVTETIAKVVTSTGKNFALFLSSFSSSKIKAHNERFISPHDQSSEMADSPSVYFIYFTTGRKKKGLQQTSSEAVKNKLSQHSWPQIVASRETGMFPLGGLQGRPSAFWPVTLLVWKTVCISYFIYDPHLYLSLVKNKNK